MVMITAVSEKLIPVDVTKVNVRDGGILLTLDDIAGCCGDGLETFERLFPTGSVVVTVDVCARYAAEHSDYVAWLAENVLPDDLSERWDYVTGQLDHVVIRASNALEQATWPSMNICYYAAEIANSDDANDLVDALSDVSNDVRHLISKIEDDLQTSRDAQYGRLLAQLVYLNAHRTFGERAVNLPRDFAVERR